MHPLLLGVILAQVASPPALAVSPSTVNLNPAQQQVLSVTGVTPPLQATLDQRLVSATVDPSGYNVTVTASQATGTDVLHLVDAAGGRVDVPIRVAFNAGTIVAQTTLTVTGDAIDPAWLTKQVTRSVSALTRAQPDARVTIGAPTIPATLNPGQTTQITVPVQITAGGQYFDQTGTTVVNVQNVTAAPFVPTLLFYDDDPEHVAQDGVLFRGTVSAAPARLFYYHDDGEDLRHLVVILSNRSQEPSSVHLVDVWAGPNMDVMYVGHTVSKNFLLTKSHNEGTIVDVPADQPYVLLDVPMTSRQLVSGSLDVRVLSGGPIDLTVLAVSPGVDPRSLLGGPILPGDGHHRTGVFQISGFGSHALNFTTGGPDATVILGDTEPTPPSADPAASGHDYGDYGVVHTIDARLTNPGAAAATAYLFFRPLAGPARGSFLVDGNLVELGCVRVSTPYQISAFPLAPGQSNRVVVQTMTDGGSFYPAEIGVSGTPPQPSAPPISAPDGCFPKPQPSSQSQ